MGISVTVFEKPSGSLDLGEQASVDEQEDSIICGGLEDS